MKRDLQDRCGMGIGVLSLLILVFALPAVRTPISPIALKLRWGVLIVACALVLLKPDRCRHLLDHHTLTPFLFATWSLLTTFWSEQLQLSLLKACAYILVVATVIPTAIDWVISKKRRLAFDVFGPTAILTLLACVGGIGMTGSHSYSGSNVWLYRGATGNSNMLGIMCALTHLWLLWQLLKNPDHGKSRLAWIALLTANLAAVILTGSRASLLAVLITSLGYLSCFETRKKTRIITASVLAVMSIAILIPETIERVSERVIYKSAQEESSVFHTRESVWEVSYQQARKGGVFGAGFAVTAGAGTWNGSGWHTSIGYGREKGNSQLAIVEETGIIGLILYLLIIAQLLSSPFRKRHQAASEGIRAGLRISAAAVAGFFAHSVFEAWATAPGAPESLMFWTLAGINIGFQKIAAGDA